MIKYIKTLTSTEDKRRLISNFFSLSALQAANYILPLITLPYLVRVLGVEYFGLISFVTATIAYFQIITDYGFDLTATREISIHRDDKTKLAEIFSSVMTIKVILMVVSFLLLLLLVFSFEKFKNDALVYLLTFGTVIGQVLFPVWFFQGMERMKYITYINIGSRLLFTIAIFIFVQEKSDFYMVPVLSSLGTIFGGLYALYFIRTNFEIKFAFQKIITLRYYLNEAHHIFISQLAISLYTISTTFILGLFTNNTIVGYFAAADKIIQAFKSLMVPVSQALYPYMASKFQNEEKNSFLIINKLSKIISAFTFIISLFLLIFSDYLSNLFLGNSFDNSIILIQIMSFLPMIIALSNLYAVQGLYALGQQKLVSSYVIKVSLFHLAHVFIMVNYFEAVGAVISVVITEILITVLSVLKYNQIKRKFKNEAIYSK